MRAIALLAAVLVLAATLTTVGSPDPVVAATPPRDDGHHGRLGRAPRLESRVLLASERFAQRADAGIVDTSSRAAVTAAYREAYLMNLLAPQRWTGDVATCQRGTIGADYAAATLGLVNYFRNMAGLPGVSLGPGLNDPSQAAALIMDANDTLTHHPAPDATCYTSDGYDGASHANLCYNCVGPNAIRAYMHDYGSNNRAVGHRRWVLYPPQTVLGTGSTPQADALYVIDPASWVRPTDAPEWISWPPPGYVPHVHVYPRFSLSRYGADFGDATVRVALDGKQIPATVVSRATGMGDPAIVFEVGLGGLDLNQRDRTFAITVDGVEVGGSTVSHSWQTTSFVPAIPRGTIEPSSRSYGDVTIGTAARRSFTVDNQGGVSLRIGSLYLEGSGRGPFELQQDGCSRTVLSPGSTCSVKVAFSPTSTGSKHATLVVPTDGAVSPSSVGLSATGIETPPSPTGVVATGISDSKVRVTWKDVDGETGYRVKRAKDADYVDASGALAKDTTSFTDSGLRADRAYDYKVCAFNAKGAKCSSVVSGTTLAAGATPPPSPDPATGVKLIDDKHAGFTTFRPGWNRQRVGHAKRSLWTVVRKSNVKRYAVWQTTLDAPGTYKVMVKFPKRKATTRKATYKVISAEGVKTVTRNQKKKAGRWVWLGAFEFDATAKVKLRDRTGERTASGRTIVFDVVKFVPLSVEGSAATLTVAPQVDEPTSEPKPASEPTSKPASEPKPTSEPRPESQPTPKPTPEPEPTAEPSPRPTPTAEPAPKPTPSATPEPPPPSDAQSASKPSSRPTAESKEQPAAGSPAPEPMPTPTP